MTVTGVHGGLQDSWLGTLDGGDDARRWTHSVGTRTHNETGREVFVVTTDVYDESPDSQPDNDDDGDSGR